MPMSDALTFQTADINENDMYKLMIASVVPRPIAWVSSMSKDGVLNLAPFSFFTVASRNPPTLMISIGPGVEAREGTEKDTLVNIREVREFVINMVPATLGEAMVRSSASLEQHCNEFELAGVTPRTSQTSVVPAVLEAPISFELSLDRIIPVGTDQLILGIVKCVHIAPDVYAGEYKIDIEAWRPLASLAGNFAEITPLFSLG
ncbi:flavin reductase family protein [Brevibacillus reuszeri]|uniref:flavin reductase family protein n=1 Tax=Brevibacillus reuszeri TaxID=54915 RepID=UPI0028A2338F|nr:flavin reductase family protein [Brevibacillus reuszeri]